MDCLNCSRVTFSQIKCPFCLNNFCSFHCLESHLISNHPTNNNSKKNIYEKPKISRIKNKLLNLSDISSPYITYGFMAKNLIYDKTYDLNNFIPEMKNNKPIIIGTGSYGKVLLFRNIIDKKLYAIKHMDKKCLNKSLKTLSRIYDEIYIQSRIFHQNIVRLLYVKETSQSFNLVMEYAKGGSLFYYIREKKYLSEKESFQYFSQIINAVYFLHKNDLIHRDIKPENILLYDSNICKLCDFGWCVKLDGKQRETFCGTTEYMSPEIVNKVKYSKEIDIWCLGILLYEMIHGYSPFKPNKEEFNPKEVIEKIKIHKLKFNMDVSQECKELICHLLDENAENRYKIEDIFNSNFIKKYENRELFFPEKEKYYIKEINPEINNTNSNIKEKNENNKYYDYKLNIPHKSKIKINNSQNMLPTFLKNASLINNKINKKIKNLKLNEINYTYNDEQTNIISKNMINDNLKHYSVSLENKNNKNKELNSDVNNKSFNICSSDNLRFAQTKKLNLSYHKNEIIFNNIKIKDINSKSANIRNKHKKKVKTTNINNFINNNIKKEIKSLNISSINNMSDITHEENNKKKCITSRMDNILFNNNLNKNKRKINLNNFYYNNNKIKNTKEKNVNVNDKEANNTNYSVRNVKKIYNVKNIKDKNIINFNNYFITYRGSNTKIKQNEKIAILNNSQKQSLSYRESNSPKGNIKKKNVFTRGDLENKRNDLEEKIQKRKIANSLKLNKISNIINKYDIIRDNKQQSLINNYNLNTQITQSINDSLNHTLRCKNYTSFLTNQYDKSQINTNYIFNPKISITLPTNSSFISKSKQNNDNINNYKIIYTCKNSDSNIKDLKILSKSQSFLKSQFFNTNNKKTENNIKLLKNKNIELNLFNKRKKFETYNKNEGIDTPRFNTERESDNKYNLNIKSLFNETEMKLLNNKKYIKMNDIKKNRNIKEKNNKINIKAKSELFDNNIFNLTEEDIKTNIYDKFDKQRSIKPKLITSEKSNNYLYLKKINHKINLNSFINNDEKLNKNKLKENNNYMSQLSERIVDKNKIKEKNDMNLFSERINSKKSKRIDDLQKTPKKNEDKIKIIPSELLNNFSIEFNLFKNKGIN